jgi:2-dehydro-3-deoxy-D-arabinonate dehydratase
MKIYRTAKGVVAEDADRLHFSAIVSLDSLIARDDLDEHLKASIPEWQGAEANALADLRAPIGSQEVWGAGVTYYRSRVAPMEQPKEGGDFYSPGI